MKTKAVRLYGKNDLRLEDFSLPEIEDNEILAKVICDSVCMSTHKAVILGEEHKRVPADVSKRPIIPGHELAGEIVKVGKKYCSEYMPGQKFCIQPAINDPNNPFNTPGYSFEYIGGMATYIIIPEIVISNNCLIIYEGDAFYKASLAEPLSCVIGGFNTNYHTINGEYNRKSGIKNGGSTAILAGGGPMGLAAIDFALNSDNRPKVLVVTDIDEDRIKRASCIYSIDYAKTRGVELYFLNTYGLKNDQIYLRLIDLSKDKNGYDDVFVYAINDELISLGDRILAYDGCLNFFAGPTNEGFSAPINFYNIHYKKTHIVGNSGGNTDDMILALDLMSKGKIDPSPMITHVGGLDSAIDTVINLPQIKGSKKLIYTHISMPLTALSDFKKLGEKDSVYKDLANILDLNNGMWSKKAEDYLLNL